MTPAMKTSALILLAGASIIISSCGNSHRWLELNPEPSVNAPSIRIAGAVHYMDVEGGIFAIQSTDGTQYNPVNLPESYRVDGMAVEADARVRTDLVSGAMIGPIVELLRIRTLPGK